MEFTICWLTPSLPTYGKSIVIFSCESDSTITNVCLFVCLFVCLSAKPLNINSLKSSSFIIHPLSFFIHPSSFFILHSSFVILHSSFLHFSTFKLFSLFIFISFQNVLSDSETKQEIKVCQLDNCPKINSIHQCQIDIIKII